MTDLRFEAVALGHELPKLTNKPISRHTLALYAGASGDHNPMHIDIDFVRKYGMEDVFAHGMLAMAYLGKALTNWFDHSALRNFGVRFSAITRVGDQLICSGKVVEKLETGDEKRVRLELTATDQNGEVKLIGDAVVAIP